MNSAEFGNLAARHNLVEIAKACRREADACTMDPHPVSPTCGNRRCWLLASPIPQEYDVSTVEELAENPASVRNLAARHILVEITEACRKEADVCTRETGVRSPSWIRQIAGWSMQSLFIIVEPRGAEPYDLLVCRGRPERGIFTRFIRRSSLAYFLVTKSNVELPFDRFQTICDRSYNAAIAIVGDAI